MQDKRSRANASELVGVLRGFGLDPTRTVRRIHGGAGNAAKFVIQACPSSGAPAVFLKCRPRRDDSVAEIVAQHAVRAWLERSGLPVRAALQTAKGGTLLLGQDAVFELSPFSEAEQWEPSPTTAREAGRVLRAMHGALQDFQITEGALRHPGQYPGGSVEQADGNTGATHEAEADDGSEIGFLLGTLAESHQRTQADESVANQQIIHGDYHPGNTRWCGEHLEVVLDFDACRIGSPLEEAAVASVHFSLDRSAQSMATRSPWPDTVLFEAFWNGYGRPSAEEASQIPWLAAAAFAREALAGIRGEAFDDDTLGFASGVVAWLVDHAEGLAAVLAPRD